MAPFEITIFKRITSDGRAMAISDDSMSATRFTRRLAMMISMLLPGDALTLTLEWERLNSRLIVIGRATARHFSTLQEIRAIALAPLAPTEPRMGLIPSSMTCISPVAISVFGIGKDCA